MVLQCTFCGKPLKSNMDRFIECKNDPTACGYATLKSNMDRFIVNLVQPNLGEKINLKSNMDRFIVPPKNSTKNRIAMI